MGKERLEKGDRLGRRENGELRRERWGLGERRYGNGEICRERGDGRTGAWGWERFGEREDKGTGEGELMESWRGEIRGTA